MFKKSNKHYVTPKGVDGNINIECNSNYIWQIHGSILLSSKHQVKVEISASEVTNEEQLAVSLQKFYQKKLTRSHFMKFSFVRA